MDQTTVPSSPPLFGSLFELLEIFLSPWRLHFRISGVAETESLERRGQVGGCWRERLIHLSSSRSALVKGMDGGGGGGGGGGWNCLNWDFPLSV